MQSDLTDDGKLVLRHTSAGFSRLCFAIAGALALLLAYQLISGRRFGDGLVGAIAGTVFMLLVGTLAFDESVVVVDPRSRTVRYRRRWAWKRYEGEVPFDAIESVLAERPIGDRGVPSRRIVLHLRGGESVPLTAAYRPDLGGETLTLSERIREAIGLAPLLTADDRARALARAGRTLEAIRELQQGGAMTREEAKRRVDELRERGEGRRLR
jgi:hypothetical protein